jgi:putative protease
MIQLFERARAQNSVAALPQTAITISKVNVPLIKPEVMSPAGYWPQLRAAIEAGADAVYFGLKHFTARAKVGFALDDLPDVMQALHRRGVRGYLTFNTLVFDHELDEAARSVALIATAGVDAIIVQDMGIARLAKEIAPALEIHGSTQMSVTSAEGVELARQFGVERVVLARELSLADIRAIRAQTDCQLEMFVHGALCVSYSGQCFSSEAWGGRSANRGQCAQACRLPYEMLVDGEIRPLGSARYLLSPEDLYALREIPEIVKLGISALKIEGRYKDENYVALATRAYRRAVDEAWAGLAFSVSKQEELQLAQIYSRGLGPHFLRGTNHQAVVPGRSPRHRGVLMGKVTHVLGDAIIVVPEAAHAISPLKPGDGLVFDAANWRSPEEPEEGGRVYEVTGIPNGELRLRFANNAIDFARVRIGDWVWRSHDPELDKLTRPFTNAGAPVQKRPIQVFVTARVGEPLDLEWSIENTTVQTRVRSDGPLAGSQKHPVTLEFLRDQLDRLGNTPYVLAGVGADIQGDPFVPSSLLNDLRRQAISQLEVLQGERVHVPVNDPSGVLHAAKAKRPNARTFVHRIPELHLLVRTPEQLEAAVDARPRSITLDYLDLYGLRPAVERVRTAGIAARVASPRVLKPEEQRVVNFLRGLNCDIVVRSTGLLHALRIAAGETDSAGEPAPAWIGDFSLNASNILTAQAFLDLGLERLTPTHDLNAAQVADLARTIGAQRFEVIAFQHLPVFHTEHCVFCRFLSSGTSHEDCGHPCEKHRVALRDTEGRAHPIMADVGCRNTVFGAEAQEASRHLQTWLDAGIEHYRLEFVHETADQVLRITAAFADALSHKLDHAELRKQLQRIVSQGLTEGSLFVPENYLEVPHLS